MLVRVAVGFSLIPVWSLADGMVMRLAIVLGIAVLLLGLSVAVSAYRQARRRHPQQ